MKNIIKLFIFLLILVFNLNIYGDEAKNCMDNIPYKKLLSICLKDGVVNFTKLEKNKTLLKEYFSRLEKWDLSKSSENCKKAIFINAYNALILKIVSDNYPLDSIKDVKGVWMKFKINIGGKEYDLRTIRFKLIKELNTPKAVFCLYNSSFSGPLLRKDPYEAENIDSAIEEQVKKFINNEKYVRLDKKNNILYISSIFKWYKKYLGSYRELIKKYIDKEKKEYIEKNNPKIKFLAYDWFLNDAKK